MTAEIVKYQEPDKLELAPLGKNYKATINGRALVLKRDEDFMKIPKAKVPVLTKSGAEKVTWAYGLLERYTLEAAEENHADGFYFYRFRCDLCQMTDDRGEVVIKSGWGSANTREGRNGFAKAPDTAHSTLLMAKKRAMVNAAITIGRLSGMFTQDLENDAFVEDSTKGLTSDDPNAKITPKQVKRLFAIANNAGLTNEKAKNIIGAMGYTSSKDITQADYDKVCKAIEEGK
jgi:hypothetical protein